MSIHDYGDPHVEWEEANAANEDGQSIMDAEREAAEQDAAREAGTPVDRPTGRLAVMATSPEGHAVVVGPVGTRAAAIALHGMLFRAGWQPQDNAIRYMSRAEWLRALETPGGQ